MSDLSRVLDSSSERSHSLYFGHLFWRLRQFLEVGHPYVEVCLPRYSQRRWPSVQQRSPVPHRVLVGEQTICHRMLVFTTVALDVSVSQGRRSNVNTSQRSLMQIDVIREIMLSFLVLFCVQIQPYENESVRNIAVRNLPFNIPLWINGLSIPNLLLNSIIDYNTNNSQLTTCRTEQRTIWLHGNYNQQYK